MNSYNAKNWADIYALRYDWINAGFQSFIAKFDPELYSQDDAIHIKDKVSVVVYGSSQVGKTSFILELLGIHQDKIRQVKQVLRGGRIAGNSSTATVTRYCISWDNFWHIALKDDRNDDIVLCGEYKGCDDESATKVIGDIRKKMMSSGESYQVTEVDIYIPKDYVDEKIFEQYNHKDIIIRDLPGVNAQNDNEQQYVISSIAKKINAAEIVILMTRVDDLTKVLYKEHLHSDTFPMLDSWWCKPNKFLAVFTSAFSNQSNRELIEGSEFDQSKIIEKLRYDLLTQCRGFEDDFESSQIYLSEVGDSWYGLIANSRDKSYVDKVESIKKYFFEELRNSILLANSPLSRLRNGHQIGWEAERLLCKKEKEYKEVRRVIEGKLSRYKNHRERCSKNILQNKQDLADLERKTNGLKDLLRDKEGKVIGDINNKFEEFKKNTIIEKKVSILREHLNKAIISLERLYYREFTNFNIATFEIDDIIHCFRKLDEYVLDSYFIDDSFDGDLKMIQNAYIKQSNHLRQLIEIKYNKEYEKLRNDIDRRKNEILFEISGLEQINKRCGNEIDGLEGRLRDLDSDYELFCQQRHDDIAYSKNFNRYMLSSLSEYIQRYSDIAKQESDPRLKLLWIMLIRLIKNDKDKVCA